MSIKVGRKHHDMRIAGRIVGVRSTETIRWHHCWVADPNIIQMIGGKKMDYKTKGVCSQQIHFEIEDNKIHNVSFVGGCNGNLQGISHLVEGMDVDEAISRLEGIQCGFKTTSCPDQLAKALKEAVNK